MKVVVSRSGGIAGIRTTWEVDVDAQPDAAEWLGLITALPWADVTKRAPEPDRFVYHIRCARNEVVLAEPQVCGPWKELVDRVKASQRADSGSGPRSTGPRPTPDSPLGGRGVNSQPPG